MTWPTALVVLVICGIAGVVAYNILKPTDRIGMKINVEVTQSELSVMDVTPEELKAALVEQLDRGVTTDDGGGSVDDLPAYTISITVL